MHLSRVQSIHRTKPNRNQARTRVVASNISDVYLCGRTGGRDVRRLHEHTNCACHLRGRTAFGSGMASRCRDKGRRMQTTRESRRRRRPLRARWKLVAVADVWRWWYCQKPTLDHALELASVRASMLERVTGTCVARRVPACTPNRARAPTATGTRARARTAPRGRPPPCRRTPVSGS